MNHNDDIFTRRPPHPSRERNRNRPGPDLDQVPDPSNGPGVIRVAGVIALSLFLVSFLPKALVPMALHKCLFLAGLASVATAVFFRDRPFAPAMTRWDEAAILLLLSYAAMAFVDPQAVAAAMQHLQQLQDGIAQGAASQTPPRP